MTEDTEVFGGDEFDPNYVPTPPDVIPATGIDWSRDDDWDDYDDYLDEDDDNDSDEWGV